MVATSWQRPSYLKGRPTPNPEAPIFYSAGIAVNSAGQIEVADKVNDRIVQVDDITGAGWTTFGTTGAGFMQFNGPAGVAVDSADNIYASDQGNNRIIVMADINGLGWTPYP
jgi:DNA-binding beta-propeller fold protein YncE